MSSRKKKLPSPPEALPKRLVIEHTDGPLKGLFRICGLLTGQPVAALAGPFSVGAEAHIIQFASLIRVYPKWAHYREAFAPKLNKFGEAMPTGFHPSQV